MNKFLQTTCYAITFLIGLYVGVFFGFLIPSEQFTLANDLPGKPLPGMLLFFFKNPDTVYYLFLYPWLFFVGLPLFSLVEISYWNAERFLLRFSVFLSLELFLVIFTVITFYSPFVGIVEGMSDPLTPLTWVESITRDAFWILTVVIIVAIFVRASKPRR